MIWYIILSIFFFALIIAAIIFFSPIVVNIHLYVKNTTDLSITAHWLNPLIIRFCYDYKNEQFDMYILGKQINKTKKEMDTNEKTDDTIEKYEPFTHAETVQETETLQSINEMTTPEPQKYEPSKIDNPIDYKQNLNTPIKKGEKKSFRKRKSKKENTEELKTDKSKLNFAERLRRNPFLFFVRNNQLRYKCLRWVKRIIKSMFKIVQIKNCFLLINAGLNDYSATGKVYGYIEGIRHALNLYSKNILLLYQPSFSNDQITIKNDLKVQSSLFRISVPVLVTFVTFPYLTFFMTWWDYRNCVKKGSINAKGA